MKRHKVFLRAGGFWEWNTPDKHRRNVRLDQKIAQITKMQSKVCVRPSKLLFIYDSRNLKTQLDFSTGTLASSDSGTSEELCAA